MEPGITHKEFFYEYYYLNCNITEFPLPIIDKKENRLCNLTHIYTKKNNFIISRLQIIDFKGDILEEHFAGSSGYTHIPTLIQLAVDLFRHSESAYNWLKDSENLLLIE